MKKLTFLLLASFVSIIMSVFPAYGQRQRLGIRPQDRKSTRLNSSHSQISYAVFCLKKQATLTAPDRRLLPAQTFGPRPLAHYTILADSSTPIPSPPSLIGSPLGRCRHVCVQWLAPV